MSTNEHKPELGKLITEPAYRDAVHIAICPVKAGEVLQPGEFVGFKDEEDSDTETVYGGLVYPKLGIVDPFLTNRVKPGERFYLFLLPNTITSLRHEWTHPGFKDVPTQQTPPQPKEDPWLLRYARQVGLEYDELLRGAENYLRNGHMLCGGEEMVGYYTADDFWENYDRVMGRVTPEESRGNFFRCAC